MNPDWEPPRAVWVLVAVSVLGGLARQAHQWLGGHRPTWRHLVARAIISLFIGVVCSYTLPEKSPWSFAATSLLGWLGADGVVILLDIVLRNDKRR